MIFDKIHKIFIFAVILTIVGCESEPDSPMLPDPEPIGVGMRNDLTFVNGKTGRAEAADATDEESSKTLLPNTIGVFGVSEITDKPFIFTNQIFYYINGNSYKNLPNDYAWNWPASFTWPGGTNQWPYPNLQYWDATWKDDEATRKKYQFYAYAPHSSYQENMSASVTTFKFDEMAKFTMNKIPPLSSYNYMIATNYEQKTSGNTPMFKMQNLSARICMRLKIGDEYSRLRKIRITEITVNDREPNSAEYYKCEYQLAATPNPNVSPTLSNDGTYVPKSENAVIPVIPIFEDQYGLLLTQTYRQFGSLYCMPQQLENITINVKYDVYDLESDIINQETGILQNEPIRKDQRVSNNVVIGRNVQSGYYYNINIVVSPDFLYVLSDNDVKPDILISPID